MSNAPGLLIVFSGPSGAGKDTVLRQLLELHPELMLSVSATTRTPREGEVDGKDYFFLSKEEFVRLIEQGGVLEYAEYCGNYYGTPKAKVEEWLAEGKNVILEIEVQGGKQIRKKCPDSVSIFILPPSIKVLGNRLRRRQTEEEQVVRDRLAVAREEIKIAEDYDYVVINDALEQCVEEVSRIIDSEKLRSFRMKTKIEEVLVSDD